MGIKLIIIVKALLLFLPVLSIGQNKEQVFFISPAPEQLSAVQLLQTANTYEIVANGEDPVISFQPLETDLPDDCNQLSFDYFSTFFLDDWELIFESGGKQVATTFSELSIMEGWSLFSINIAKERKVWGKRGDILRFRLGKRPGYRMQIRNIRFREMNAFEKEQAVNRADKKRRDDKELAFLNGYLDSHFCDSIALVNATNNEIVVSGYIKNPGNFYLAELPLHARTHLSIEERRLVKIPGQGPFTLRVNRTVRSGRYTRDALFSKWVIVEKNKGKTALRSHAHYADSVAPGFNLPDERPRNKKGLGDFNAANPGMLEDIDSLGVTSVTVNVWIRGLLNSVAADTTMPFLYNGRLYHANKHWVALMDQTMIEAAKRDLTVSAIILVDQAFQFNDTTVGKLMAHPDCDPAGVYCMPYTSNAIGMEYLGAALDFMAARYSRPDKKFGRIHHWIAHNEIDAGWTWTNMGEKDPLLYMDAYHTSMRLIYLTARKYNPHANTFISLTHNWNWTPLHRFYRPKELLEILLRYSSLEGDFDWGIGYHPFPQSLFEPRSWSDDRTDFSFNTPMITFRNVEVIDAWVNQPHTYYRGKQTRILHFSEQGPNSRDYSEQALLDQASSMAYVWKKIKRLNNVKVFHYQSWRDYRFDGGLRLGLRRYPDDENDPLGRKPVWEVFRCIDTDREDACLEFAKPIIGITNWEEIQFQKPIH